MIKGPHVKGPKVATVSIELGHFTVAVHSRTTGFWVAVGRMPVLEVTVGRLLGVHWLLRIGRN